MIKNNVILENEEVMLSAKEFVVEGALVVKAKANGEVELLDINGSPVVKISVGRLPKTSAVKSLQLKSFTIELDHITLTSDDVEILPLSS